MTTIGQDGILKTMIILPPIEKQKQFLEFVKQTDKSKLAIQKSLEKLEILKKSLMQQYFG
jgi:type I restriction enzyme S subunit